MQAVQNQTKEVSWESVSHVSNTKGDGDVPLSDRNWEDM